MFSEFYFSLKNFCQRLLRAVCSRYQSANEVYVVSLYGFAVLGRRAQSLW